jgi:hypothetical protein
LKHPLTALLWLASMAVLPVFAQSSAPSYQSLTRAERWNFYWNDTLLSSTLVEASFASAVADQITHDPPEWRQGVEGYARRSASEYGVHVVQATIHQAGAAALGYDPRYLACDCKGFWRRSAHAVKWSFLTRNNEGATRADIPAMAGAYGAGMISMSWYPKRFGGLTDGVRVGNQEMGLVVGFRVIREFAPDLKRFFHIRN